LALDFIGAPERLVLEENAPTVGFLVGCRTNLHFSFFSFGLSTFFSCASNPSAAVFLSSLVI